MPIIRDESGHSRYLPFDAIYYKERPQDFLGNGEEYDKRVEIARFRVLEAVRFASTPLMGRGLCHEVTGAGKGIAALTDFVDKFDNRRVIAARKHRHSASSRRIKSPQDIKRRRSSLFSGAEICPNFFKREYGFREQRGEREQFVDLMRWWLLYAAIERMTEASELFLVSDIWYVPVTVLDAHRPARRERRRKSGKSSKRTKYDDRSFHGKTNRDRGRQIAA